MFFDANNFMRAYLDALKSENDHTAQNVTSCSIAQNAMLPALKLVTQLIQLHFRPIVAEPLTNEISQVHALK